MDLYIIIFSLEKAAMLVSMAGGGRKVFRIMSLSLHLKLGYAVRTLSSKETVIASVHSTRDMQ